MVRCGKQLAQLLQAGDVVRLCGTLGAGKTVLARSVIQEIHPQETDVPSPTFPLVQFYEHESLPIWHFDLYRLENPDDVWELGLEEALEMGVSLIEWPQKAGAALPDEALTVEIDLLENGVRRLGFFVDANAHTQWSERMAVWVGEYSKADV